MRLAWLFGAAVLLAPASALADPAKIVDSSRPPGEPDHSLWRDSWPTFSWLEGAATVAAGAGTLALALNPPPDDPRWQGGILFDDATRDAVRLSSQRARKTARTVGDWPYYTAGVIPLVIDPIFVAWLGHGDGKAALNLGLMGLEAFSYAGFLSFVSTRLSVRERPDSSECRRQPGADCEVDTESFWSGHTSIVAASAGLVCSSHRYMALWGGSVLDAGACVLATGGALTTGISRIMADRHYASDVLVGGLVGFAAGYAVPVLLHYERRRPGITVSIQSNAQCPGGCVGVAGTF